MGCIPCTPRSLADDATNTSCSARRLDSRGGDARLPYLLERRPFGQAQSDARRRRFALRLPVRHEPFPHVDTLIVGGHRNVPPAAVMIAVGEFPTEQQTVDLLVHVVHAETKRRSAIRR